MRKILITLGIAVLVFLAYEMGCYDAPTSEPSAKEEESISEWEMLQLAIVKTESDFNTLAVGRSGDLGIFQITEIYTDEVNRISGEQLYFHSDAFNPKKAKEMFDIYQDYYNPNKDINRAIYLHNPNGDAIGYSVKVLKNLERIREYEQIRALVKK